jgi:uncharacterized delta-60 repeat protein
LWPNGTLDTGFNPFPSENANIFAAARQPDGKIIMGGSHWIFRLNISGSQDATFTGGVNGWISTITLQPDGNVIIGGHLTTYNGTPINHLARLNANGSLDTSFNLGTGVNDQVLTTALQSDGKIVVGGDFTSYNGIGRNRITRLNADGSLDSGFNSGTGADSTINTLAIQPDGKIIIGGEFDSFNGTTRIHITRLQANGSLDSAFNQGTGASGLILYASSYSKPTINASTLLPDGKIIIGGFFNFYNGIPINSIARMNSDGSLDTSFNPEMVANSWIRDIALQPDGKIIISGINYSTYNEIPITRLNADGSLDASFNPGNGASGFWTAVLQPDGKIVIGGDFTSFNGLPRNRIVRLNADGSLD